MNKFKTCLKLFLIMLKIGLFTFGGGYAMISLLENEFVTKRKWLENDEFLNIVTIAESTPGPIAINAATYVGYKRAGFWGSLAATVAACIPSFIIIYLISLFFEAFIQLEYVAYAFEGIQVCVIFLILSAGVKMFIKLKKTPFNIATFIASSACMIALSVLAVNFSSVYYVLIAAGLALAAYLIVFFRERRRAANDTGDGQKGQTELRSGDFSTALRSARNDSEKKGCYGRNDTQNAQGKEDEK